MGNTSAPSASKRLYLMWSQADAAGQGHSCSGVAVSSSSKGQDHRRMTSSHVAATSSTSQPNWHKMPAFRPALGGRGGASSCIFYPFVSRFHFVKHWCDSLPQQDFSSLMFSRSTRSTPCSHTHFYLRGLAPLGQPMNSVQSTLPMGGDEAETSLCLRLQEEARASDPRYWYCGSASYLFDASC